MLLLPFRPRQFPFGRSSPTFSTRGVHDPERRSKWTSWLKGLHYRSDVLFLFQELSTRTDARWRLVRQRELELFEQDFLIGFWMGVAAQNQSAAVGRREVYIEHLDGGKLLQNGTWGQAGCQRTQPRSQGHLQAVGQEGDKDMSLDPTLELVKNGAQRQVVFQVLKGRFDFD